MRKISAILLILSISIIPVIAQDFFFENFSTSHGLAGSKVYTIEEDKDHFVWVGTEYGISRFDGTRFLTYTSEDGLAEGGVKCIVEDKLGQIIFGHYDGNISILNSGSFLRIDTLNIQGDVRRIYEDGSVLWIATDGSGLLKINSTDSGWDWNNPVQFMGKEGLSDRVFDIYKLKSGTLLFISDAAVKYYDEENNSFKVFKQGVIPAYFQVTSLLESSNGYLFLGTHNGGIYRIDLETDKLKYFDEKNGLSHNFITAIEEDKNGLIWVGTFGGGMNIIKDDQIIQVGLDQGIDDEFIQSVKVSSEGMVLIGSNSNGLQVFKGFQFSSTKSFSDEKLRINDITKIGSVYYGVSNTGIIQFDLISDIPLKASNFQLIEQEQNFNFIKKGAKGRLWVVSEFEGVFSFDIKSEKLSRIQSLGAYLFTNKITSFDVDSNGDLWIGTINGLLYYDNKKDEVELLSQENNLISRSISAVYNKNDTIYIGFQETKNGINYIVDKRVFRIRIPYVITPTSFLKRNTELWIGTLNHGVFILENDSLIRRVNSKNGLLNDHVQFLEEDLDGSVWIGNNKGLNAIRDFESYWVENYDSEQGVLNEQILRNSSFIDDENRLWTATSSDMIVNLIDYRPKNLLPSKPVIESVQINEDKVNVSALTELKFSENDFIIKVASPNLYAPRKTVFYYKIDGYNSNWVSLNTEQEISLMNLNPGNYSMHLKSIGFDGSEQIVEQPLNWTIKPPWYLSPWFLALAFITILVLNRIYIQIRERNLKREKELLEGKVKERTRLIVLKNNQLAQKNKDITDSLQYASRIQHAVLPSTEILSPYGFVYFRPKDIVSGDFYFISRQENSIYVCAADCTGHGVPGALLSIMGRNIMELIISSNPDIMPGKFLDMLNTQVAETLQKDANQAINDGMDLALVKVNFNEKKVYYAGAYNPLYLVRKNEIIELKADRFSIGSQKIMPGLNYTTKELDFEEKDRIYLCSDGLPDQFGGKLGKKMKTSGLKKFLLSIQDSDIGVQSSMINDYKMNWQGEEDQVDDILLIGFEISKLILKKTIHD